MTTRRLRPALVAGLVAAACPLAALAETIGMSWARFQEERWVIDEAALEARLGELGHDLITADARGSVERQAADIEGLLARGVDLLMVVGHDTTAVIPAVERALAEGIPVIAYERQIKHPDVLYVGFDPVLVGRAQARALMEVQPEGNYVLIKGGQQDQYAHGTFQGQMDVIGEAVDAGKIAIIAEQWTTDWKPEVAQSNMENIITAHGDAIDAVLSSNDGMASGVVAALEQAGMAGLPLSGQDGDVAAINRIALGTQTMTAWKDVRVLGARAAEIADAVLSGTAPGDLEGATVFTDAEAGIEQWAVPLEPTTITRDTLGLMLEAGWVTQEEMCRGVEDGTLAVCDG
jgi:D-xylose transport system substrate-binding protein